MSKTNKNIEDLFRSNFENYKIEPSFDAWDKIDSKLSGYGFNNYFNRIFNSHKVIPSEKLWPKIARKVWIANFVKFQPFSFNIYNVGLVSSVIILVTIGLNNTSTIQNNIFEKPIIAENNTKSINDFSNSFVTEVNTSFNEDKKSLNNNPNRKKFGFSEYLRNAIEKASPVEKENDIIKTTNPIQSINSKYIVESQLERDNSVLNIKTKKDDINSKVILPNTATVSKKHNNTADTVGVNALGKPILMERQKWSYDVYTALVNSQSILKTDNKEFEKIIKDYESKQSTLLSYSVGLNVNYEYYGFVLQGGLSYSQLGFTGNRLSLNDSTFNSNNYMGYIADSARFSYDSLSYNDTLSSILLAYDKFDTLSMYGNDSLLNNKLNSKNKYRYFEFPLTVSYSVKQNNFTFGVTGGLITGLFINVSEGPKINSEKKTSDLKKENPYAVPNFSSYLGFYVGYELNNNSAIFLEPYYRKSLNSIYTKESYFTQKFTAYGARVGLRYSF
ncbi:MAG: hypothetical protein A2033_15905 [Bacteroidetes bacterium GWA2_31_9]|nr:MAG: hypothetical protein A2033_15905 [Bacteroidetes bacterium GWA2_31_9]